MTSHAPKLVAAEKMKIDAENAIRTANIATDPTVILLASDLPKSRPLSIIERDMNMAETQLAKQKKRIKALKAEIANRTNPQDSETFQQIKTHIEEHYGEPIPYTENVLAYYNQDGTRNDTEI